MRNFIILICLIAAVVSSKSLAGNNAVVDGVETRLFFNSAHDTLRDRAILLLEEHMDKLKNIDRKSGPFQTDFIKSNPKVPCDYCEKSQEIELSMYVSNLQAPDRYPNGLEFTYERIETYDDIVVQVFERGLYNVIINVKKTVVGLYDSDKKVKEGKKRTSYLKYVFELDYNSNIIGILSLSETKPPGVNMFMLELNPNLRLTPPDFSGQQVFDATSSTAALIKFGAVYYFNPFKGINAGNFWFKTGLRISYLSSHISSDLLDFRRNDVALDGNTSENPHNIDLLYDISNLNERVTALGVEIPVGFSKRFTIGEKSELSLEVEASYTIEFHKEVSGDYTLDLTGTNHLINSDVQSESGGSPVLYQSAPQAVLSANGEIIGFSRNNAGELDINEPTRLEYFSFSFRPSVFFKKFDKIKYNVGLNLTYVNMAYTSFAVDEVYFDSTRNESTTPLQEADQSTGHFFAGIFFGIKI